MANRFWRGGSGTWNSSNTANWSTATGGAGGASVPTSVDDVFFDVNSGTPTVTISFGAQCRTWNHAAGTATFLFQFDSVMIYGGIAWSAGTNISGEASLNFAAPTGSFTVNCAGRPLSSTTFGAELTFSGGAGTTWTLAGAFNFGANSLFSRMSFSTGTVNTAGVAIQNLNTFEVGIGASLILGASTVGASVVTVSPDATISAGSSTLNLTPGFNPFTAAVASEFSPGGKTYGTVTCAAQHLTITGSFTASVFTRTGTANNFSTLNLRAGTNVVCTTSISLQGNSATNRLFVFSPDEGSAATISAPARTLANVDFRRISAVGSGVIPWALGTSVGDCMGNSGILFTPSTIRYAVATGNWSSTTVWSAASGGAAGASVPLPQDDVQFTSASGNITVSTGTTRALCRNLYMANFIGVLTLDRNTATGGEARDLEIYGDIEIQAGVSVNKALNERLFLRKIGTASVISNSAQSQIDLASACSIGAGISLDAGELSSLNILTGATTLNAVGASNVLRFLSSVSYSLGADGAVLGAQLDINATATLDLGNSTVYTGGIEVLSPKSISGGQSTLDIESSEAETSLCWTGTVHNISFRNFAPFGRAVRFYRAGSPTTEQTNRVTGTVESREGSSSLLAYGYLTLEGDARFGNLGRRGAPVLFGLDLSGNNTSPRMQITNNTSFPLQTENAFFSRTTSIGTMVPGIYAFGVANLGQNSGAAGIVFPTVVKTAAFTNFSGSWDIPGDFGGSYYVVAFGGGGQGGVLERLGVNVASGGGGGGACAINYGNTELAKNQRVWINAPAPTGRKTTLGAGAQGGTAYLNYVANTLPSSITQGVAAQGGFGSVLQQFGQTVSTTVNGGQANMSVGQFKASGGQGTAGFVRAGAGGGSPAYIGEGWIGGSLGPGNASGGGGGGVAGRGIAPTTTAGTGGQGGPGGGGNGGIGGPLVRGAGANGSATLGGGGGGGGALVGTVPALAYQRPAGATSIVIPYPAHGFTTGDTATMSNWTRPSGGWTRNGTAVSCGFPASTPHGLVDGQTYYLLVTTGTGVPSGNYVVTVVTPLSITFTVPGAPAGISTGGLTIGQTAPANGSYTVTVIDPDSISLSLAGATDTTYTSGTANMLRATQGTLAGAGGNGGMLAEWTYDYLNGAIATGAIGPGGGGGGGGAAFPQFVDGPAQGGPGGDGGIGAGGGGGGNANTTIRAADSGSGGAGLVVFVYGVGFEASNAQLIG